VWGGGGLVDSAIPSENCFADCFCQFFSYHPSNIYTMKVYVSWEHPSNIYTMKVYVAWPSKVLTLKLEYSTGLFLANYEGYIKLEKKMIKLYLFLSTITNESLLVAKHFFS
jgi:hypothetical protein